MKKKIIVISCSTLVVIAAAGAGFYFTVFQATSSARSSAHAGSATQTKAEQRPTIDLDEFLEKQRWGNTRRGSRQEASAQSALSGNQEQLTPREEHQKQLMMMELQRYCMNEGRGTPQCGGRK